MTPELTSLEIVEYVLGVFAIWIVGIACVIALFYGIPGLVALFSRVLRPIVCVGVRLILLGVAAWILLAFPLFICALSLVVIALCLLNTIFVHPSHQGD